MGTDLAAPLLGFLGVVVTTLGTITVVILQRNKRVAQAVAESVGSVNGEGPLTKMVGEILVHTRVQSGQLNTLTDHLAAANRHIAAVDGRLTDVELRQPEVRAALESLEQQMATLAKHVHGN